ncbi:Arc family DNA-binding protein [Xenorhabdus sp. 12]|uniref:Arc family DNA-binding protein n=1 Tax=Xenorhabdus santafensis TaxID=2582833 RepID=A0ABU4SDR9_9GAMM|nr:TraY domain-containing protein [Xenorhabdus sp. 12]MDX7988932.1 Arc family DNA-binding protein [Xenorhabdus sp. 12]
MSRIAPYPLRMPPEMRSNLEDKAQTSARSLQQEILFRLEKYQQIETLIVSTQKNRGNIYKDDIYDYIAELMRKTKSIEEKDEEINRLKKEEAELRNSLKLSETDRFMKISQQSEIIEKAIGLLIDALPPNYNKKAP